MKEYYQEYESLNDCKIQTVYLPFLHTESMYFSSIDSNHLNENPNNSNEKEDIIERLNYFKSSTLGFEISKNQKRKPDKRFESTSFNRFSFKQEKSTSKMNSIDDKIQNQVLADNSEEEIKVAVDRNTDIQQEDSNNEEKTNVIKLPLTEFVNLNLNSQSSLRLKLNTIALTKFSI